MKKFIPKSEQQMRIEINNVVESLTEINFVLYGLIDLNIYESIYELIEKLKKV